MIHHKNLPSLLGNQFDPAARYCMVESNTSGRGGAFPSRRQARATHRLVDIEPPGTWQSLGEFSDPEIASARQFRIYQWVPSLPVPKSTVVVPSSPEGAVESTVQREEPQS